MQEQSAYTLLGLTKGASEKDVRSAYVNLVKKYDPEKHTERFMVIQKAFDKLKTPKTRAREDLFTFNTVRAEYLYPEDEKWQGEGEPSEAAIAPLRAAHLENPGNAEARTHLIRSLLQRTHYHVVRKQFDEAIRDWDEVLEIDPGHLRARRNLELACCSLAHSYALHGLNEEAMELWERALLLNPDSTDVLHNLALAAERAQRHAKAGRYWGETLNRWKTDLTKDSENEYLKLLIVEALNHHGDYVEQHPEANVPVVAPRRPAAPPAPAPSAAPSAPLATPRPAPTAAPPTASPSAAPPPRSTPAPAATDAPKAPAGASGTNPLPEPPTVISPSVGVERYREILRLRPDDFDAHFQLCNKLYEERLWDEAADELKKLSAKHPKNIEVLNLLGWALLNGNQVDAAFLQWNKSLAMDPKNAQTRENLVRAHTLMGQNFRKKGLFTHSLVHFKKLLTLMPKSPEVHLEIAATYDMKGDVRSAVASYNAVLELDPKNKVARKAVSDLRTKR